MLVEKLGTVTAFIRLFYYFYAVIALYNYYNSTTVDVLGHKYVFGTRTLTLLLYYTNCILNKSRENELNALTRLFFV